jgi:E3 ubiquitin-protein ligase MARCH5
MEDTQETNAESSDTQNEEIQRSNNEIDRILNISLPSINLNSTARQMSAESRYCWVCFATDEEDQESGGVVEWVKPCKCKGTLRHVHQSCLQRWVDEKQKGNSFRRVQCQQCQTEYIIVLPSMGVFADVLEAVDTLIRRSSPFLAAGVFVGSLYWTAVTYGAITVLQVLGHNEGLEILESTDHIFLMIALPAIPCGLVLGRMIRWEDYILRYLQNRQRKNYRLLSLILPIPDDEGNQQAENQSRNNISDTLSTTRVLCGALLLPSISSLIGRVFFNHISNNLHRTLLGGLTFIAVKGVFKIYFKQKQFMRKKQRKIVDYTEENIRRYHSFGIGIDP